MSDELVREQRGPVLLLRLNRPDARNALSRSLMYAVGAAVAEAEADPGTRVVVLTGTGDRAFSAGLDLREVADGAPVDRDRMDDFLRVLAGEVSVPLIGAAQATALAGGLEILLGCDLIVASSAAEFGLPEVKRGLFPGGSGTAVGRRVPLGAALELLLTGDSIPAQRAYEIGLVNAVVAPDEVVPAALQLAERIAANAPLGVAACRELARLAATDEVAYTDRRDHWRGIVFGSQDAAEGAAAFMEKRPPVWTGR